MKKLGLVLSLLVCCLSVRAACADNERNCKIAADAITAASSIRELAQLQQVPCLVQNREQVKEHLLETIRKELPPGKLEDEGLVYRALGAVPDAFDYKNRVVDIYLSQIGGYYDPKKKQFVMADWSPEMMQTTVAVHELTHALQDQHFNLERLIDMRRFNGDELLARSALVEGDASAVMLDYNFKLVGQPGLGERQDVQALMMQNVVGAALTSSLQDTPRSLVAMMIFPYTSGLRFVHFLLRHGGFARVSRAYREPPRSSEEILHPEKYGREQADFVVLSDAEVKEAAKEPAAEVRYADVLGEFSISALLYQQQVPENAEAAAGWGGDRVLILAVPGEERPLVAWRIHWDTAADADEFVRAYTKGLRNVYPQAPAPGGGWSELAPGKSIKIERAGQDVTVLVRMPKQ